VAQTCSPLASRSVSQHLARGGGALLAFGASVLLLREGGQLDRLEAMAAAIVALVLLRGCPLCWLIGLFETITMR
jgi:hypothetical protein